MAACQGNQKDLEPETMAQVPAKKRKGKGRGKPAPDLPAVREEAEPEGDALALGKTLLLWEPYLS